MGRRNGTGRQNLWPGATAVTNKGKHVAVPPSKPASKNQSSGSEQAPKRPQEPSATQKEKQQKADRKRRVQQGDEDEDEEPVATGVKSGKKRQIVHEPDEDEDGDEGAPSSDTLRSGERPSQKKPRLVIDPELDELLPERDKLPFLIINAEYLNINDKDAVRKSNGVYEFYDRCLNSHRMCGPYVKLESAYLRGAQLSDQEDWYGQVGAETLSDDCYAWMCYMILQEWLPDLREAQEHFHKYPDTAVKVLQYIDAAGARGRSNDTGRLKKVILEFAGIKTVEDIRLLSIRANRGFKDTTLGRLLVPMNKLKQYDADPQAFCHKVLENEKGYRFKANRWPAFLYDEKTHIPGKMCSGLFRNKFLLSCYLYLICGPSAVDHDMDDDTQTQGTPPLYQHYGLTNVTPEQIVYVAVLARTLLSSQARWGARDGQWIGKEFVASLLHVFYRNDNFRNETLDWWDKQVYGNRGEDDEDESDCEANMLLDEEEEEARQELEAREARKAAREAARVEAAAAAEDLDDGKSADSVVGKGDDDDD